MSARAAVAALWAALLAWDQRSRAAVAAAAAAVEAQEAHDSLPYLFRRHAGERRLSCL